MTQDVRRISDLVVRVQRDFLDLPFLRLTLPQARERFGTSGDACLAVLDLLVETGVLKQNADGSYARFFPSRSARHAPARRARVPRAPSSRTSLDAA
jgi:hypothetical protein